ncbi:T9SS type A sorting domain-containing protein [Hymenobacter sp. ASUV-10]|uniref:T9SS type A sorting domain-containing protein n=1 Tax=Hymenobacter aranciens TaxID=3063996 RepID=A0ABT9BAI2_9BACT|nr:T9SS type A sorting domain-containing protein [Hymenobacter sp. ASUV-10]MDO7875279.1 T9SS type A sorting domain-containing protein [Hymenobacter sp. ASUV-10]
MYFRYLLRAAPALVSLLAGFVTVSQAQAPVITTVVPMANALAVPPAAPLTVSFNQPLPAVGPTLQVFSNQRGGRRTVTTPSGNILAYPPTVAPYQPGETVSYTVVGGGGGPTVGRVGQFTVATGGAGRGGFQARQPALAGRAATYVATGDLNNDGRPDLVVTNYSGQTVSLHLQDASGGFSVGNQIQTFMGPQAPSLGDLDGDGDLDLAFANNNGSVFGSVYIRLNDGTGVFSGTQQLATDADAGTVTFGDVDADGDLDLLVANGTYPATAWLYFNDGQANFGNYRVISLSGVGLTSLALGDLDGDGDLDLAAATRNMTGPGQLSIRLNDGQGLFTGTTASTIGSMPNSLALGDVDADGDLDVLTAGGPLTSAGTVSIRLNNGAAGFGPGADLTVGNNPRRVVLGDLDADGDLDFVTANNRSAGTSSLGLNTGNGTFGQPADITTDFYPSDAALVDIDSDGDLDLAIPNPQSFNIGLYLNQLAPPVLPIITSLSPTSGPVGTVLTLTGTNLTGTTSITFAGPGGNVVTTGFTVNAAGTQITGVVVPAGAISGPISVTTPGGTSAPSPQPFIVTPVLNSLVPGPGSLSPAFAVFPNPARGTITVTGSAALAPLTVLDALGRPVLTTTADAGGTTTLRLPAGLAPGLYLMRSGGRSQRLLVE